MSFLKSKIRAIKTFFTEKIKHNSLVTNVWLFLIVFSVFILTFLWIFQILFLGSYYKSYKTKELNNAASELAEAYQTNNLESMDSIAFRNDICIEIYDERNNEYSGTYFNQGCIEFGNKNFAVKKNFINSGLDHKSYNLINNQFNNNTLIYALKLDNETYAFLNASLVPIDSTVDILRSQLIYITLIVLILSLIVGYFISKKISNPITKINEDAKKMAEGDYRVKFSTNEDIYEINELVDTLNYAKTELSKTDELKRDLMANVGHDLKTPLTMIRAYAEMVRDLTYNNKEKRENNLNIIINETERLNLLVSDILDLSYLQTNSDLTYEDFDLVKMIDEIIGRFNILTEKENYHFILEKPKDEIIVKADKKRIYQVIYNLINNAINYTGKDKKVYIIIEEKNNCYRVNIKDTGKGINEEELKHIWDKYYHSDKKHKRNEYGTGLGLSIVKNILQNHNFKYGVDTSSKGTTFYFEIKKDHFKTTK